VSLLLHAIAAPTEAPLAAVGLRAERLVCLRVEDLTLWSTSMADEYPPFTREDLLDHHRVVSAIFAHVSACLPARFPAVFQSVDALCGHVAAEQTALHAQLERVRDACELAVTAAWRPLEQESTPPVTASSPGRKYLLQRQIALSAAEHRRARASQLADELEHSVGADLLESARHLSPSHAIGLSLALLVPRHAAPAVVERLRRTESDVRILVNGPWPPYTFASIGPPHQNG
jgi:Gas vesicle synthesis protein GvpL/GvpF